MVQKICENGDEYEGYYENDLKQGKGVWRFINGRVYIGDFKNDKMDGKGRFSWPETVGNEVKYSLYIGEYKENKKHGRGTLMWAEGRTYEEGKCPGHGNYDGIEKCDGNNWFNGNQSGYGVMKWNDGTRYEGHWKVGKQEGSGRMIWPDGKYYDGYWENGKEEGEGIMTYADGGREKRTYKNGVIIDNHK